MTPTLDEWQEETVIVKATMPEMVDGKIEYVEKEIKGKQRVMYVDPPSKMVMCARGKHDFTPKDPSRGIFACRKCDYKYKTYPVSHEFFIKDEVGYLRSKKDGSLV